MRRLVAAFVLASVATLGAATGARSQQPGAGTATLQITGWGSVRLAEGLVGPRTVGCAGAVCPASGYRIHGPRIVLTETPYPGWSFAGWRGACSGRTPECVIDVARHAKAHGRRNAEVGATFVAVAAGLTPDRPVPLGTTAAVGDGFEVRVNSVIPDLQLSPAAPPGQAYFAANVTLTDAGSRAGDIGSIDWVAFTRAANGALGWAYVVTAAGEPPAPAPEPRLDYSHPLQPGRSTTGYVCWTVDAHDAPGIDELGVESSAPPSRTTWFALR